MLSKDGMLLRENFTVERMAAIRRQMEQVEGYKMMSDEEREANRRAFFESFRPEEGLWVFGYGSLMWNPAFHVAESQAAQIHGYHRSFCLHLMLGRGSADKPGLMLALDRGGSCKGIAHRIAPEHFESETEILWMREMIGESYQPTWVEARTEDGPIRAFTFVMNRESDRYAGRLTAERVAKRIARAEGVLGTNRDYLYRTVERLDALGIGDGPMHALQRRVRELAGD